MSESKKAFDAEGNPIIVTLEETPAGVVQHVQPDTAAAKEKPAEKPDEKKDAGGDDEHHRLRR